jgi:hypothetical protein
MHVEGGLRRSKLKRKPVLSDEHKSKRLEFARRYMDLGEKWKYVIFSDEKKFNLDGPDGYDYYWHAVGDSAPVLSRRTYGGRSVMVWASFNYFSLSKIAFIDGTINSDTYQSVLSEYLLPFIASQPGRDLVFQQDNARPHVSKTTVGWLRERNIECLTWPPY